MNSRKKLKGTLAFLSLTLSGILLPSCNVFDSLDSPTNDEQILSAARLCFDQADLECAKAWYQKLSGSYLDVEASEMAFVILHQNGVSMAKFLGAVGKGSGGAGLTALANKLAPTSGESLRNEIYRAYKTVSAINAKDLRGFVRFVTGYALLAELLAEESGTDRLFQKTDYLADENSCNCLSCAAASTSVLTASATVDLIYSGGNFPSLSGTYPTLGMVDGAIDAILHALVVEIGAGGNFSTVTGAFIQAMGLIDPSNNNCFRFVMKAQGLGL